MFAPGAAELAADFGITSEILAAFTVSIYLLGFGIGPLLISPLSEIWGRLIVIHVCNVVFIGFTIGCAASTNTAMFMIFRFIAGCACSAPMTIGGAVIADVTMPEQRGKAMSVWALGPLMGPVSAFIEALGNQLTSSLDNRSHHWRFRDAASILALGILADIYPGTPLPDSAYSRIRLTYRRLLQYSWCRCQSCKKRMPQSS